MILPFAFLLVTAGPADVESALKRFTEVFAAVESNSADPINTESAIYGGAIPSMLRELDPHSVFFDPQQFQQLKEMEQSEQKGFGTVVSIVPGRVVVLQAMPGTPSARAGLSPGDEIVAVNNAPLAQFGDPEQLIQFLTEARQKRADLLVRRPGSLRPLEFTLDPQLIDAPTVDRAFMLRPGIGYVRVASFDPQTAKLLKNAIEGLGGAKLKGLVLDLRNNTGGVVPAALECASYFLKPGQQILTARGRSLKGRQEAEVPKNAVPYEFPLAVLVNEKTASAAEIVTGALQDHDRATVVGTPTYGKGLVQSVFPLSGNTAMALTTAFYYTPSGRSIQKPLAVGQLGDIAEHQMYKTDKGRGVAGGGGIQPDIVVYPEQPDRLLAVFEGSGVLISYATDYIQKHKVTEPFKVTPDILDDFQVYASERRIQPSVAEWMQHRDWIQSHLEQEILDQALGVAKGDEVQARSDPQVKAAVASLGLG